MWSLEQPYPNLNKFCTFRVTEVNAQSCQLSGRVAKGFAQFKEYMANLGMGRSHVTIAHVIAPVHRKSLTFL